MEKMMIILLTPYPKKNLIHAIYITSMRFVAEKGNDVNKVLTYKHLEGILEVFGRFQNTLIKRCKKIHTTFHKL
jgi:hypothetical protein